MRDFIITTDSNCDLSPEFLERYNIQIISHYYEIDGEVYGEDNLLSDEEFYARMRKGSMPVTMASNPAVIRDTFQKAVDAGKDVLHISFSSALSGGCSNVTTGGQEIMEENPGSKIIVFDTLNVSFSEGLAVIKAAQMREEGKTIDEINEWLKAHIMNFCCQFTVDDLFHLHRGGRVSAATAVVGTLVGVKPILYVDPNGGLVSLDKARGRKKSLATIVDNMFSRMGSYNNNNQMIGIVHGDCIEDAKLVEGMIREQLPDCTVIIKQISPSIGAHAGPGAVGVCFMGDIR